MLLPSSNDQFALNEEEEDDIGLSGNINLLVDVSGIVKSYTDGYDDTDGKNDDGLDEPYPKDRRKWRNGTKIFDVNSNWYKNGKTENVVEGLPSAS